MSSCQDDLEFVEDEEIETTQVGNDKLGYVDVSVYASTSNDNNVLTVEGEQYFVCIFDLNDYSDKFEGIKPANLEEALFEPNEISDISKRFINALITDEVYVENMSVGEEYGAIVTPTNGEYNKSMIKDNIGIDFDYNNPSFFFTKDGVVLCASEINIITSDIINSYVK